MNENKITWAQWLRVIGGGKKKTFYETGQSGNTSFTDKTTVIVASNEPIPDDIVEKLREVGLM